MAHGPTGGDDPALDKRTLPADVRRRQEKLFTRAWLRLQAVANSNLAVDEYPLPDLVNGSTA